MERKFRITVDGHAYTVTVEEMLPVAAASHPAAQFGYDAPAAAPAPVARAPVAAPPPAHAAPSHAAAAPGDVVATLAGVVESIPVKVGDSVEMGQPVVIVEAMKMKSPMVAPRSGKVGAITIEVGQGVDPGQVLASIS